MFGLGFGEMVVIALLAIVVVGPSRLPTLFKTVGGAMRQLRQASRDIRTSVGLDELIDLDPPSARRTVARAQPPLDAKPVAKTNLGVPADIAITDDTAGATEAEANGPDDGTPTAGQ